MKPRHAAADPAAAGGLLRERFPILGRSVNGRPLIYLDSAATTQKPEAVIAAEADYYRNSNANVHRGLHTLGDEATRLYEGCRAAVAGWLAVTPAQVTIQRSATSAINLVARGWEHRLSEGDAILVTEMEHHANFVPWQMLAARKRLDLRVLPVTDGGELDMGQLDDLLDERVKIVAIGHISNVLGTVNPVAEICGRARNVGALTLVDAAQSVGHRPLTFADTGADLLVFSAHKCYGPMGLGFLVGRPEVLAELEPLEGGGEMIEWVRLEGTTWAEVPHRFEAGTPNVAAAAAFPAAIALLEELGLARVRAHEQDLTGYALEKLAALDGLVIFGPGDPARRGGLVSFHDPQVHPHDLSTILDQLGIAVRAGHHCAQPLHRRLGVVATTRASFGVYTARDEIDALVAGILEARKVFAL
ncbi:MAG: aminotransferase class V-fold PLP-dependent enzyme [Candidatus Krumholzibacteriia bacterium]